jgi:diguanylate cyclase (GGDEF)-like protein/PAS domain S-box-containing protein
MSLAQAVGAVAGILAAVCAVVSLWRGSERRAGPVRQGYRWLAFAAGLWCVNLIIGEAAALPEGVTSAMLSFADLPGLLVLPAMAVGMVCLASPDGAVAEAPEGSRSRPRLATVCAQLADGCVLACALFLVGWVMLFGPDFSRSGETPASFTSELVHPLADLAFLGIMLGSAVVARRRGVIPYLALAAVTVSDALAVGGRVTGTRPGVLWLLAGLAALVLLALTPWGWRGASSGTRWTGGPRGRTTAVAGTVAAVAAVAVMIASAVSGRVPEPVVLLVLGATAAALGARVVGLVRRVNSWARVWEESGTRFRQLADRTSDVVLLCGLDGVVEFASRAVADYGYTPESMCGLQLAELLHPEDKAGGMRAVRRAVAGPAQRAGRFSCRVRAADGTWRHVEASVSRYRDPGGPDQLLVSARDLSAQVALRRQVTHLTFHDGLTGLPNRAFIEQRAQDVLDQDEPVPGARGDGGTGAAGVIILDVDGFTAVNETVGHNAADLLLAQVARRLRLAVSPQDTVARWGGDEFAVLIEGPVGAREIGDIAERLARSVASQPFRVGDADVSLTASVGVAIAGGGPAGHAWRNAETVMTHAKEAGPGQVEVFGGAGDESPAGPRPESPGGPRPEPPGSPPEPPGGLRPGPGFTPLPEPAGDAKNGADRDGTPHAAAR